MPCGKNRRSSCYFAWAWFFICFWHVWRWSPFQTIESSDHARSGEEFLSEPSSNSRAGCPVSWERDPDGLQSTPPPCLPPVQNSIHSSHLAQWPATKLGSLPSILLASDQCNLSKHKMWAGTVEGLFVVWANKCEQIKSSTKLSKLSGEQFSFIFRICWVSRRKSILN